MARIIEQDNKTAMDIPLYASADDINKGRDLARMLDNKAIHGLEFKYMGAIEVAKDVFENEFTAYSTGSVVLVDDFNDDTSYISLRGFDESSSGFKSIVNWINENMPIASLGDVSEALGQDIDENRKYIHFLALLDDVQNPADRTVELVRSALRSDIEETVLKRITTAALFKDQRLKNAIAELKETSGNPLVQEIAELCLIQM